MSEYQWYEFIALDRPLSTAEMAELRGISTRAEITATRFSNEYQWGDLKADPADLLARYFDVHLYFANWGTRRLMFRLPRAGVDLDAVRAYLPGGAVGLTTTRGHVVLDLVSETEEPEDDWFEGGHLAGSLTPLRAELLQGDRRMLYVAWLLAVQAGEVGEEEPEPPVPSGLADPAAPLAALAEFLRVDPDLLAAAGERAPVKDVEEPRRVREWVEGLPAGEQRRWLLRAVDNPSLAVGAELVAAFRRAHPPVVAAGPTRTVEQLLGRAEELAAARRRQAEARLVMQRAAAEAVHQERLVTLAQRGAAVWGELEQLVDDRSYEQAVALALELREVMVRAGEVEEFDRRVADLKQRYGRPRRGFFDRLKRAGVVLILG